MSRMYSRKKGKSGSTKPLERTAPWVKYKPQEIEEIVVKLAKKERSSADIGTILRDQYGIPSTRLAAKNRISRIMKKHKVYNQIYPEDMFRLLLKAVDLSAHLEKNKKDYTSKRGMELTESKIRRLGKYYKKKGVLPEDWKYDLEKTKLLVK
jgi:small subunit ribosomal protein S15